MNEERYLRQEADPLTVRIAERLGERQQKLDRMAAWDQSEKASRLKPLYWAAPLAACLVAVVLIAVWVKQETSPLDELGIAYDDTPGVSSFCGAAASLNAEYTLPGVSQSVIITRLAGRTPVPERESLASLAAHGTTMVVFLSAGMLESVQRELLRGAYTEETPAAIVYKATWPEEKVLRCTVGTLARCGEEQGIRNTALVLVGDFLKPEYERSKLYDPSFTTGFRRGTEP